MENFELQLEALHVVLETEDVPLKEKSWCFLNSNDSIDHYLLFSLASSRVSWDAIRASIRTMPASVVFLTSIANYTPAEVSQAQAPPERGASAKMSSRWWWFFFYLFFSPMKLLFVFSFQGLLKIV